MNEINDRLRLAREKAGFVTAADAARALGVPYGTYSGHENNNRGVPRDKIAFYARRYKVSPAWLLTGAGTSEAFTIPIVGIAGAKADGTISYEDAGHLGEAPMINEASPETVAVEVKGDSMRGIAEDGWLVYYDEHRDPPTDDLINEVCIIGLEEGGVLLKKLYRGSRRGLWNLESTTAPTMRDVRVEWAAPVLHILTRYGARRNRRR